MLYTEKLRAELERKRDLLAGYQDRYGRQLAAYRGALATLGARFPTAEALREAQRARLTTPSDERPRSAGAYPTQEYDRWRREATAGAPPALRFGRAFAHHEEARAWAELVRGVTTIAVDGSQLLPWRDASVPVALVQAGLFENPHQPPEPYIKAVTPELLTPDDLLGAEPDAADARSGEIVNYSSQVVNLRRFELEIQTLIARMERRAGERQAQDGAVSLVALYDGSLIASFSLKMPPQYRARYVAASRALLAASERCRAPLIGYIDTSYARDIVTLLGGLAGDDAPPETRGVHDALLWGDALAWGDRTPAFISARDDLERLGYGEQRDAVGFVYLQTARDRAPARLEFPRWLLDDGLLDATLDVVRAEVVAGAGYPYAIEAADAVAVISMQDRAQFYALFQEFAEREGLGLSFSHKALSKNRRRV